MNNLTQRANFHLNRLFQRSAADPGGTADGDDGHELALGLAEEAQHFVLDDIEHAEPDRAEAEHAVTTIASLFPGAPVAERKAT